MNHLSAFVAGFLSTLVFHQGLLWVLYAAGAAPKPPFDLGATAPLRVPAVISLAFWGGLWGIALALVLSGASGLRYWMLAVAFGALAPTVVALFMVFPLKGLPPGGGGDLRLIARVLLLNGAWGAGAALLLRTLPSL